MAKIVIIAPADTKDIDDAVKLLKAAGHDVDVEEPSPKALLHIVLGLMGPNAYGFGPGYAYTPGDDAADADKDAKPEEGDESPADAEPAEDDFNFENTVVDGETINATYLDADDSILVVEELDVGLKTTYRLNESKFSFWPADVQKPMQRVDVGHDKWSTSVELQVVLGEKAELRIGKDLLEMFGKKNTNFKNLKPGFSAIYAFDNGKSEVEIEQSTKDKHSIRILKNGKIENKVMTSAEIDKLLKTHSAKFTHVRDHNV